MSESEPLRNEKMEVKVAEEFLAGLMRRYRERVPDVESIVNAMMAQGMIGCADDIENDHIAFRTMGVEQLGIASLEKIFLAHGFEKRDSYHFEKKKLDAFWYAPPVDRLPRIFISELRVGDLSKESQEIIRSYTDEVESDPVDALDLNDGQAIDAFLHQALWRTPTLADYKQLAAESEYAAWVIYNRYYLNHFTVSVNNLPAPHNTVAQFNEFLETSGFRLNDSGGKAKTSKDGLLIQSSTVAGMVDAEFDDGSGGTVTQSIAGSYVEFAQRMPLPEFADKAPHEIQRQHRRDGFATGNADRIFESTYSEQTQGTEK